MDEQSEIEQKYEETLLRYDEPVPIDPPEESQLIQQDPLKAKKKQQLPPLDSKPTIEEILNAIFPPKRWEENLGQSQWFEAKISCDEAKRQYLEQLEDALDFKMQARQARKCGICPVREDLHNQLFDEIIRQCTVNCPERGLLLLRVRDNLRMTFAAYQTLYQGSIVFGVKKAKQAEEGQAELEERCEELKKKKIQQQNRKIILENELDSIEKSFKEIREIEEQRRIAEKQYLETQKKHLTQFLQQVHQQNQQ